MNNLKYKAIAMLEKAGMF